MCASKKAEPQADGLSSKKVESLREPARACESLRNLYFHKSHKIPYNAIIEILRFTSMYNSDPKEITTMQCTKCHAESTPEAKFCHQCGTNLTSPTSESTARDRFADAVSEKMDLDDPPEKVLWQGSYSILAMASSWALAGILSVALLLFSALYGLGGTGWLTVLGVLVFVWAGLGLQLIYRQLSVHYYMTNQRFIHERGLLWREIDRIEAIDIDDVSYQQGPVERMLSIGTILIRSRSEERRVGKECRSRWSPYH